MEGPSIYLAAEWLKPLKGKIILSAEGNTRIGKDRLEGKKILDIFSWGKHLIFQFDDFAMRIHFLLFGSFEATIKGKRVTGDYPKKKINPRLKLDFDIGELILYSCSLAYIESSKAKDLYDFSIDVLSPIFDAQKAFRELKSKPQDEIADVLLDQTIFAGVGNIIKNEVLFLVKRKPTTLIADMKDPFLKKIVRTARDFSFQFYEWRKQFALKKQYQVYRQSLCPVCKEKICRKKTGKRARISFYCLNCQK